MEQACLLGVAALTAGVYLNTTSSTSSKQGDSDNKSDSEGEQRRALRRLQRVYLPAHLLALFSDWLQGPYVFQLYRDYGYSEQVLYCTILYCTVLYCTVSRAGDRPPLPGRLPLLLRVRRPHRAPGRQVRAEAAGPGLKMKTMSSHEMTIVTSRWCPDLLLRLHPQLPEQADRQLPRAAAGQAPQRGLHLVPLLRVRILVGQRKPYLKYSHIQILLQVC